MYKTKVSAICSDNEFLWDAFFSRKKDENDLLICTEAFNNSREILKESDYMLTLVLKVFLDKLLKDTAFSDPQILELGAATGFLSRMLLERYNGRATLVDNNENSYLTFIRNGYDQTQITYLKENVFELNLKEKFDIICSFGLIEHFDNKKEIIDAHTKFLKDNGLAIIIVPLDSILSRVFYELHPELNLGYRELLNKSDMKSIFKDSPLHILSLETTSGYVYDFIGVLCNKRQIVF
jgi:2-polyprenyl-3-methyl-5-hydroxy-6-metoxy-1,4-benzoquinol methylase